MQPGWNENMHDGHAPIRVSCARKELWVPIKYSAICGFIAFLSPPPNVLLANPTLALVSTWKAWKSAPRVMTAAHAAGEWGECEACEWFQLINITTLCVWVCGGEGTHEAARELIVIITEFTRLICSNRLLLLLLVTRGWAINCSSSYHRGSSSSLCVQQLRRLVSESDLIGAFYYSWQHMFFCFVSYIIRKCKCLVNTRRLHGEKLSSSILIWFAKLMDCLLNLNE